jgi:hypothetical protein
MSGSGGHDLRIALRRTGGFAGATLQTPMLDVGHLDPAEAAEIGELVRAARLEELPAPPAAPGDGPPLGGPRPGRGVDRFGYVLTVQSGGLERRVLLGDEDLTPERRALLARLETHARQRRGNG